MRAEPQELELVLPDKTIDEHEVGSEMAVAASRPFACQLMVVKAGRKRFVGAYIGEHDTQQVGQVTTEAAFQFAPQVAAKGYRAINRP